MATTCADGRSDGFGELGEHVAEFAILRPPSDQAQFSNPAYTTGYPSVLVPPASRETPTPPRSAARNAGLFYVRAATDRRDIVDAQLRTLAKHPPTGFASAGELVEALEAALAGRLPLSVRHRGFTLIRAGARAEAEHPLARRRLAHG